MIYDKVLNNRQIQELKELAIVDQYGDPVISEREKTKYMSELAGHELLLWNKNDYWNSSTYEDAAISKDGSKYYDYLLEREDKVYKALKVRKLAVTSNPLLLMSQHPNCEKCKKLKRFIKLNFDNLGSYQPGTTFKNLVNQMLEAIIHGFEIHEKVFVEIEHGEFKAKYGVCYLKHKRSYDYKLLTDKYDNIREFGVQYKIAQNNVSPMNNLHTYETNKFIITQFDPKIGNPYGGSSINLRLSYLCFLKRVALDFWGIKAQRYGIPSVVLTIPNLRDAGLVSDAKTIVENYKNRSGIVIEDGMELTLLEATESGRADLFQSLIARCDQGILNCINLSEYSTDDVKSSGGGRALTKQAGSIRDELAFEDGEWICSTLNTQLVNHLCQLNFPKDYLEHMPRLYYPDMNVKSIKDLMDATGSLSQYFDFDIIELFKLNSYPFPDDYKKVPVPKIVDNSATKTNNKTKKPVPKSNKT